MSMIRVTQKFIYCNLANAVSLLGVLPLVILFLDDGYLYVIPLIVYNNFIDDLDGVLAAKLDIKSRFGANLDNVCDAVAHISLALAVGAHFGGFVMIASATAAGSILIRTVTRLNHKFVGGAGSQTNELMRHLLFSILLAGQFNISPDYILIVVFLIHSISMVLPYSMPHFIVDRASSPALLGLINISLVVAWLVPIATVVISVAFAIAYINSFIMGSVGWRNKLALEMHQ